jgi:MoaA/NifB/PqqE/SkfB family radical SAM enzyme
MATKSNSLITQRGTLSGPFTILNDRETVFDNTKRMSRIASRQHYYLRFFLSALFRIPFIDMLRQHFAFLLPDMRRPAFVTVEFTNYCDLKCPYCSSPLRLRPQGMMSETVFTRLVQQVRDLGVNRVRIVGDGEALLHPRFNDMIGRLARACRYLTIVTNGQRLNLETITNMLRAPLRLIEVSVDSNCKENYEKMRIGGSFDRLLANLVLLKQTRNKMKAPALINIRAMIHPSERASESDILEFWRPFGDTVIAQYLHDGRAREVSTDTLFVHSSPDRYPHCTVPLKTMSVMWNGKVPLCDFSEKQTGNPEGLVLGNIADDTLQDLWNHKIIRQYRQGHRDRDIGRIPICQNCVGG